MSGVNPIRCLIVDDEAPARSRLRHLLKHAPDFAVVAECANGQEAVETIRQLQPEVVFLDVQMPVLDGFATCAAVGPERMPCVVFVTAYNRFALQAFEVHAVDYVLKPIDRDRFERTLDHLRARWRGTVASPTPGDPHLAALLAELKERRRGAERLAIKVDGRIVFVRHADIDWLEAEGNYVRLHAGPAHHLFRDTLSALEADLPGDRFIRISRSAIVNVDAIKELQPLFYGDYAAILRNGAKPTLSRSYRERVESLLVRRPSSGNG